MFTKQREKRISTEFFCTESQMESYNYKMFRFFKRKFRISEVEPPMDVKEAFATFAEGESHMSADQLRRFRMEFQGEGGCTLSDAEWIIGEVVQRRHHLTQFARHTLALDDFFYFLFSGDLNGPIMSKVCHDMTAPLPHYFIYTGHNSYLTGNQLSSACSEFPIIKALQRGVRVIELDLWPNSRKDNVHVLHGRTLTEPVALVKCLKSIKEHAFVKSLYPVIITLEDHLTPDLQAKVAEMFSQTFGEMLYYPDSQCLKEFPSPEALKRKIVLSTKPPKEYLELKDKANVTLKGRDSSEEDIFAKKTLDLIAEFETEDKTESDQEDEELNGSDCTSSHLGAPEYRRLIAIHAGKPKGKLKEVLKGETNKVKRLSLSEQALEKAAASHGTDVVRYTQRNLLRVYPKGTRLNSSNYKPMIGWTHGAQMVAFNMQGYGKSLCLMHGMFRSNGGCGYVKKPDFLMKRGPRNEIFDPKVTLPVKKTLKVRVYMGDGWRFDFSPTHFDSYSPPDFYTKVSIVGVPADAAKKKTKVLEDDWVPVWDEEFIFPLTVPELALLRIEVREYDMSEKDDFGGQTCLPISELRTGIRAVPLFDRKGEKLKSVKLLMRFNFL